MVERHASFTVARRLQIMYLEYRPPTDPDHPESCFSSSGADERKTVPSVEYRPLLTLDLLQSPPFKVLQSAVSEYEM